MTPELSVKISADIDLLRDNFRNAIGSINKLDKDTRPALTSVDKGFEQLANEIDKDMGKVAAKVTSTSNTVSKSLAKTAAESAKSGTAIAAGSDRAAFALTNMGRIAQDLPFGFVGIQNNLNPMLESFQRLKAETGSNANAFRAMAQSLMGPAGLGIALSVVSAGILLYQKYASGASDETKKITSAVDALNLAVEDTDYLNAVKNVNELRINIGLAKDGILSKDEVLKHYNETIGETTGEVNNLTQAENELVKNSDAYVKMMLYRASANLALAKAAEEAFKAEEVSRRGALGVTKDGQGAQLNLTIGERLRIAFAQDAGITQTVVEYATKRERKIVDDRIKGLTDIGEKFQRDAAEIAKKFNFDFFGDDKKGKQKIDAVSKAYKDLATDLKINEAQFDKTFSEKRAADIDSYQKAIDNLTKNGYNPASEAVANLVKEQEKLVNLFKTETLGAQTQVKLGKPIEVSTDIKVNILDVQYPLTQWQKKVEIFSQNASEILTAGLGDAFAGLASGIGESLANGSSFIETMGSALLGVIGNIATELGKAAIAIGVGMIAIKASFKNPLTAIAAGAALVALGSFITNKVSKIPQGETSAQYQDVKPIRGFASGVNNFSGGVALVGERGPELVNLPTGSSVLNNNRTNQILSANNGVSKVEIFGDVSFSMDKFVIQFKNVEKRLKRQGYNI